MILEQKNTKGINEKFYECPHCTCTFATKSDLNDHLQAFGDNKTEHVQQLDRLHRGTDRSYTGTMSKDAKKVLKIKGVARFEI